VILVDGIATVVLSAFRLLCIEHAPTVLLGISRMPLNPATAHVRGNRVAPTDGLRDQWWLDEHQNL